MEKQEKQVLSKEETELSIRYADCIAELDEVLKKHKCIVVPDPRSPLGQPTVMVLAQPLEEKEEGTPNK